jgi:phosphoglycolate phosphatase
MLAAMLILFDIDATLLTSSGAGVTALEMGGKQAFRETFSVAGVDFAGRLDPLIIADLLRANGLERSAGNAAALRDGYARNLPELLARPGSVSACPGVHPLLAALREDRSVTLGLLTGNFEPTGVMKLRAVKIEPTWFPIRVWGDESPHDPPSRDHLPAVALSRQAKAIGKAEPRRTVVIGDTPHDVACAKANGCRSVAVATGHFSVDRLAACSPDLVVRDLADTRGMLDWFARV